MILKEESSVKTHSEVFWGALDGVAVINLDDRPARWNRLQAEADLVSAATLTRISAVPGISIPGFGERPWFRGRKRDKIWAARVGCTLSHREVMRYARRSKWDCFLVLEDDASLLGLIDFDLSKLAAVLFDRHTDWDVCYLGFSKTAGQSYEISEVDGRRLCQVCGCFTTHAYLVRSSARDWILDRLPNEATAWRWHSQHRSIDRWYARRLSRRCQVYAVTPSLIKQHSGFSDIAQRRVDYSEEFLGIAGSSTRNYLLFKLRKHLLNTLYTFTDLYDVLRSSFKRTKGF